MMPRRYAGWLLVACTLLAPLAFARADQGAVDVDFFERKIRPVLVEHCYQCHSQQAVAAGKLKGKLRLDSRQGIRAGGETGPAVVPGKADKSLILEALRYDSLEMPPQGKLPGQVVADFERWIRGGAPDPRDQVAAPSTSSSPATIDWDAARQHWSFQPPRRHPLPQVSTPEWIQRPLDAFVLARLDEAGLKPNPPADRRTLIRRLYFDLVGLPPTPEEVEASLADTAPGAVERLVDRLLASPHYGERWARMWLDLARYAEDQAHIVGNDDSLTYPNAYLYRDWVIDALDRDVPFDRFVRLQLAADLIEPDDTHNLAALGFLGLGPKYYRRNAPEVMADEWEDRVDVVGRGLLGLTVACARCHDHKYDPIPTEDYYSLAGVFASTEMFNRPLDEKRERGKGGQAKKPQDALHIIRDARPRDLKVYLRGDVTNEGPLAKRGFLHVLGRPQRRVFDQGSGRLQLAEAIACRDNPLTARVIVNRVWAMHFGQPLVATPSNFGNRGAPPTHPDLLDDLAVRFMDRGWSLKWLHRQIVLSAAWRQASHIDEQNQRLDPANRLIWRVPRRRLSIEAWRDAILVVSGRLDGRVGGKSIDPREADQRRRTVYSRISRLELNPMLATFDFPDPNVHAERRIETTTPLQKLFVLNSPFMVHQAEALARVCLSHGNDDRKRIAWAYRAVYGRDVNQEELQMGLEFLAAADVGPSARWEQYAQVLLASNEMLFVD